MLYLYKHGSTFKRLFRVPCELNTNPVGHLTPTSLISLDDDVLLTLFVVELQHSKNASFVYALLKLDEIVLHAKGFCLYICPSWHPKQHSLIVSIEFWPLLFVHHNLPLAPLCTSVVILLDGHSRPNFTKSIPFWQFFFWRSRVQQISVVVLHMF